VDIQSKAVQKNGAERKRLPAVASECDITVDKNPTMCGPIWTKMSFLFLGYHVPTTASCSPQTAHWLGFLVNRINMLYWMWLLKRWTC